MSRVPAQKFSPSASKKRKNYEEHTGSSTKKLRKDKEHQHKHKQKHAENEFILVEASLVVSIPPVFTSNPRQGIEEMLDSMVMRYIPTLHGVVLTHSNLRFLESKARIEGDSPFSICTVTFDATVWSPRIGQRLAGKVNLCSPDHVSLLVHRTFNVSIPRYHIPQEQWGFEYGPAENDPEYGVGAASLHFVNADNAKSATVEGEDIPIISDTNPEGKELAPEEDMGRWTHTLTGLPLGGESGMLEFTVIGMTIANQMLSLVGSIQPDPFSTEHIAPSQNPHASRTSDPAIVDNFALLAGSVSEDTFAQFERNTNNTVAEQRNLSNKKSEKKKRKGREEGGEEKCRKATENEDKELKPRKKKKKHEDK